MFYGLQHDEINIGITLKWTILKEVCKCEVSHRDSRVDFVTEKRDGLAY